MKMKCASCGTPESWSNPLERQDGALYCTTTKCYWTRMAEALKREKAPAREPRGRDMRPRRSRAVIKLECPKCHGYNTRILTTQVRDGAPSRYCGCECGHKFRVLKADMEWPRKLVSMSQPGVHKCPKCGSMETSAAGIQNGRQRIICYGCNKRPYVDVISRKSLIGEDKPKTPWATIKTVSMQPRATAALECAV